jgi:hypothetical protein
MTIDEELLVRAAYTGYILGNGRKPVKMPPKMLYETARRSNTSVQISKGQHRANPAGIS